MSFVHISAGEKFYLPLLLTVVTGARSWADLQTFNNVEYPTYKATCMARGLLEDDGEWAQCLHEAADMRTGHSLRNLFALILKDCHPAEPAALWEQFKHNLCDDLHHHLTIIGYNGPLPELQWDYGLHLINTVLMANGRQLSDFPPMLLPQQPWEEVADNPLLQEQLNYDPPALLLEVAENEDHFNAGQRKVYT